MSVPNLPNDFNKFILLVGIVLIIYPYIKIESHYLKIESTQTEFIDSIQSDLYTKRYEKNNAYLEFLEYYKKKVENEVTFNISRIRMYSSLLYSGFFTFLVGSLLWVNDEKLRRVEKRRKLFKKGLLYDHCQSCGKRFSPMRKFGNNKDKSKNFSFCEECYLDGNFTEHIQSFEEFCLIKEKAIRDKGGFFARASLRHKLNNLERWKDDEY
jgi:hypothetical protein